MNKAAFLALLALCAALLASAAPNRDINAAERLLRESLGDLEAAGRRLQQATAFQSARGGQSAQASAVAKSGPGGDQAYTSGAATGGQATVAGVSSAAGQVDTCFQGPADSVACQTLAPKDKSSRCSDIPPSTDFTCEQQAKQYNKCNEPFIFQGAYCLKSCGRCGAGCIDVYVPGQNACQSTPEYCNSAEVLAGPYCLKSCGRCSEQA